MLANLVGAIGSGGDKVVRVAAWNRGWQEITIEPGAPIARLAWVPIERVELVTNEAFVRCV